MIDDFRDGKEKIASFVTDLNSSAPVLESKFTVWSKQNNATLLVDFKAHSYFSKLLVKSSLRFFPLPKIKEEIMQERKATRMIVKDGEYFVELTKGAKGVGMTLGWDKQLRAVVIKQVDPHGAASR